MDKPVLTVDDSVSTRQMLSFTLKSTDYEVGEAAGDKEDLGRAQNKSYSLVFTDQNIPNMDGLSLVRSLHNLASYRSMPILMLTAESGNTMRWQGRSAGATGWLMRPFDPPRLPEITHRVLP